MAEEMKIVTVRTEPDLYDCIRKSAKNGERSLNKEIIHILKKHFGLILEEAK